MRKLIFFTMVILLMMTAAASNFVPTKYVFSPLAKPPQCNDPTQCYGECHPVGIHIGQWECTGPRYEDPVKCIIPCAEPPPPPPPGSGIDMIVKYVQQKIDACLARECGGGGCVYGTEPDMVIKCVNEAIQSLDAAASALYYSFIPPDYACDEDKDIDTTAVTFGGDNNAMTQLCQEKVSPGLSDCHAMTTVKCTCIGTNLIGWCNDWGYVPIGLNTQYGCPGCNSANVEWCGFGVFQQPSYYECRSSPGCDDTYRHGNEMKADGTGTIVNGPYLDHPCPGGKVCCQKGSPASTGTVDTGAGSCTVANLPVGYNAACLPSTTAQCNGDCAGSYCQYKQMWNTGLGGCNPGYQCWEYGAPAEWVSSCGGSTGGGSCNSASTFCTEGDYSNCIGDGQCCASTAIHPAITKNWNDNACSCKCPDGSIKPNAVAAGQSSQCSAVCPSSSGGGCGTEGLAPVNGQCCAETPLCSTSGICTANCVVAVTNPPVDQPPATVSACNDPNLPPCGWLDIYGAIMCSCRYF